VVVVGLTETDPDASGVTAPIPLLIEAPVAAVVVHDKLADDPTNMFAGVAVRAAVTLGGGVDTTLVRFPAAS